MASENKFFYDLHIHSAASPCGDEDMTPNNILNMALLKELDIFSVTDHNCTKNIEVIQKLANDKNIIFVPGIEITSMEEVHLLVYFNDVKNAVEFGEFIYENLPPINNNRDFFGNQQVLDEKDEQTAEIEKLLISALPFSVDECFELSLQYGGIMVPAHINKDANSLLGNLGFMPNIDFLGVEVVKNIDTGTDVSRFFVLNSSDAHTLWDISEKTNSIGEKTKNIILQK